MQPVMNDVFKDCGLVAGKFPSSVTGWDQTSENREGDPIVLHTRFFVSLRGPTNGGGDKLDSPISPLLSP